MGLRFKKSFNLGGGFKVNLSKSGIGYSFGAKGARVSHTSRGRTRTTVGIPGTGLSHISETGHRKRQSKKIERQNENTTQDKHQVIPPSTEYGAVRNTEIINTEDFAPAEYTDLLKSIKLIQILNIISFVLICSLVLAAKPVFLITGIIGILLFVIVRFILPIKVEYEFDDDTRLKFAQLTETWMSLNNNAKFWQVISSASITNAKANGGAKNALKRIKAKAINRAPYFLKMNVKPFGLKFKNKRIWFLPDKLLISEKLKVGAINYDDVNLQYGYSNFLESESVPSDARVVGQTWLKVNKNGTPDKRFSGNRQIPICQYGEIRLSSGNSLYIDIMCSNAATVEKMESLAGVLYSQQNNN